ncbi:MAG TPA: hypothetical protein VHV82_22555 [Sporichthyaceae bacterium]|jgi:hypothetical protein|nr:hypothetical protein [Sporichthyaceae bacterium]
MTGKPAQTATPEHRARLVHLAYTILSPVLGNRRSMIARMAVEQALRPMPDQGESAEYQELRANVVRRALTAGRRRSTGATSATRALRYASTSLDTQELAWLLPATRAAYALRHLEGLDREAIQAVLAWAGVGDPAAATALAARIRPEIPHPARALTHGSYH